MANRNFNRKQALEKEVKELHVKVAIGASGAPTLTRKVGTTSIARNSQGLYTITLDDKYSDLINMEVNQLVASAQDLTFQMVAETVTTNKTIQFRCIDSTAAVQDPSSGSVLYITIELKNSSI